MFRVRNKYGTIHWYVETYKIEGLNGVNWKS